jgi:hypothetical protein
MENQYHFKKQREAILNDEYRKELFQKLFELYASSLPNILKKSNGDIVCLFSDDVEIIANKIRELISIRDRQIFESISN